MLQRSERIEDADEMVWELSLVLLLAWVIVYVGVIKGIESSGKVRDQTGSDSAVHVFVFYYAPKMCFNATLMHNW